MTNRNLPNRTITDGILHHSRINPSKLAISMGDMRITYGQLVERAEKIADYLLSEQKKNQRIGIWLPNDPDYLAYFLGIVLAHSIAVPLPADLPAEELGKYKEHLGLDQIWDESASLTIMSATQPQPETIRRTISPDDLFYMAVSSGSTGTPKGILRNHRSWTTSFERMSEAFEIGVGDTILIPGPLHYSASLIAALQVLDQGGTVVLLPRYATKHLVEHLLHPEITSIFLVPAMCAKLLAFVENKDELISRLQERVITTVTAGAKMAVDLKQKWIDLFLNGKLFEYYGAAELSFVSLLAPAEQIAHADSVGRAFAGVEIMIMDDTGHVLPTGSIGQVYVRSEMIAQGYGHLQVENFITPQNGYYSVGDVGYLDEEGYLYLTGRKQELIIRGGVNIYPLEIEQKIRQFDWAEDVAVFGMPDAQLGEKIVAVLVLNNQCIERIKYGVYTRSDFIFHTPIAKLLPQSRHPDLYWIHNQLPLGSTGKVDKRTLRKQWLEEGGRIHG
ncbi:class I adenylate-forming enzyme family protein [Brevibacillus sp. SYSU BS000544]|uniref:class I adenylate-forming enzyme family protein n=1 Tax=Brevibacillus sp. SYSU BS000544 TaxID=3416443 RepID=UPI003CE5881A